MGEIYDIAIIGSGVTGAATAYTLSRYKLKIVLLEKAADVGMGVSKANSGIIHAGFHYPVENTLKGRLEILGNLMFGRMQYELGFPFRRCGIVVAAFNEEEMCEVRKLFSRGLSNRVPRIELCDGERMRDLEPKLSPEVIGGLYAPSGGVIEPYRYVFALTELSQRNGVDVRTLFEVQHAEYQSGVWLINHTLRARYVVNAAGLYSDQVSHLLSGEEFSIIPRKGEEYLLDRNSKAYPSKVIFPVPTAHSKGVLVIPTLEGTTMIGPTAEQVQDKSDVSTTSENRDKIFSLARKRVKDVSERDLITSFSGLRPTLAGEDFFIAVSEKAPHLIQAAGIQSPGLTASPAIGEYIRDLLKGQGVELNEKEKVYRTLPIRPALRKLSAQEADELHQEDPAWTNILCRCESISEKEILEAIAQGHTTLDGIKFYTRAGMGRCQGGFCSYKILKLINQKTGIPIKEITKNGPGSEIVLDHLGEKRA